MHNKKLLVLAIGVGCGVAQPAVAADSFKAPYPFDGWLAAGTFGPRDPGDVEDYYALPAPAGLPSIVRRLEVGPRRGPPLPPHPTAHAGGPARQAGPRLRTRQIAGSSRCSAKLGGAYSTSKCNVARRVGGDLGP